MSKSEDAEKLGYARATLAALAQVASCAVNEKPFIDSTPLSEDGIRRVPKRSSGLPQGKWQIHRPC